MNAKEVLLEKSYYLRAAKDSSDVQDRAPSEKKHNGTANLIRKGLGIVGFNVLEDFIKFRSTEVAR